MGHAWEFTVKDKAGKSLENLSADFADEEWDMFLRYDEYTDELAQLPLSQSSAQVEFRLHWNRDSGFASEVRLPPEEQTVSLMHRLRPFILTNESTNFERVSNILSHRITNQSIRTYLKSLKQVYSSKGLRQQVRIILEDVLLNSDAALHNWLNAFEYHRDLDKRAEIQRLHEFFPFEVSRTIFIMMLHDKAKAILTLGELIRTVLGRQREFRTYADEAVRSFG